jgi:hypothetical protein
MGNIYLEVTLSIKIITPDKLLRFYYNRNCHL